MLIFSLLNHPFFFLYGLIWLSLWCFLFHLFIYLLFFQVFFNLEVILHTAKKKLTEVLGYSPSLERLYHIKCFSCITIYSRVKHTIFQSKQPVDAQLPGCARRHWLADFGKQPMTNKYFLKLATLHVSSFRLFVFFIALSSLTLRLDLAKKMFNLISHYGLSFFCSSV